MKSFLKMLLAGAGLSMASQAGIAQTGEDLPLFEAALEDTANWREVSAEDLIIFDVATSDGESRGRIYVETAQFAAPKHVTQFKEIVRSGDFNGTVFHRVIDDFMAQGGDIRAVKPGAEEWPNIEGEFTYTRTPMDTTPGEEIQYLGPKNTATNGYFRGFPVQTQSEFLAALREDGKVETWIPHCKGVVSAARTSDPNSASSQFFLMRETSSHLDRGYSSWGRILAGQEVVDAIKTGEPVRRPDMLTQAQLAVEMDEAKRPRVLVLKTDGPRFQSVLEANDGTNVCDLPPVPAIVMDPRD